MYIYSEMNAFISLVSAEKRHMKNKNVLNLLRKLEAIPPTKRCEIHAPSKREKERERERERERISY